ncbi:hypothetical protein D3C78_259020 [compost metagenome]
MDGTDYAGVRGRARSHMGCAGLKAGDVHAGGGAVVWLMFPVLARSPCEAALCREKPALNRPVLGFEAGSISAGPATQA